MFAKYLIRRRGIHVYKSIASTVTIVIDLPQALTGLLQHSSARGQQF